MICQVEYREKYWNFEKNQKLEKSVLNLKRRRTSMFLTTLNSKNAKKNEKKFATFWENETQKVKIYEKNYRRTSAYFQNLFFFNLWLLLF